MRLPKENWFGQKEVKGIYWFSVVAVYKNPLPGMYQWGWTNHQYIGRIDNAVAGTMDPTGAGWEWRELFDQTRKSEDMSFILFTEPGCFPSSYSTYLDWLALGKPNCWCGIYGTPQWPYQCDGDVDGINSGVPYYYRVYTGDIGLIIPNWRKKMGDPALNPCADIDHISSGAPYYYRVYTGDVARIIANWRKKDAGTGGTALPGNCPRPE